MAHKMSRIIWAHLLSLPLTETPLFMWNLSAILSDPTFQDFTDTSFFSELEAGTYGLDDLDTSAWINSVVTVRQGAWINLLPWEFKSLPLIARRHCRSAQSTLFEQAILDSFNTLDNTAPDTVYSDLLGVSDCSRS
ncbi:hypothetical protein MNBD_GAMMA01-2270 [hydrothermal vent metagenome]|uniref:Uncharacterized protein n=1 Tax=hydrothermal vent metagenome TaxID=652676 RepID=A0A3B0VYV6_9ZZZZ